MKGTAHRATSLVLDTNCWLDLLVFCDPSVSRLRDALACKAITVVSCAPMRDEILHVINRPWINQRCAPEAVMLDYDRFSTRCKLPPSRRSRIACSDPDDQIFLDLAIEEAVSALVSKDRQLLRVAKKMRLQFQVEIMSQASLQFQEHLLRWTQASPSPLHRADV